MESGNWMGFCLGKNGGLEKKESGVGKALGKGKNWFHLFCYPHFPFFSGEWFFAGLGLEPPAQYAYPRRLRQSRGTKIYGFSLHLIKIRDEKGNNSNK